MGILKLVAQGVRRSVLTYNNSWPMLIIDELLGISPRVMREYNNMIYSRLNETEAGIWESFFPLKTALEVGNELPALEVQLALCSAMERRLRAMGELNWLKWEVRRVAVELKIKELNESENK